MLLSLLYLIVFLIVVGVGLYLFNTLVTAIDPKFKSVIVALVCLLAFLVSVWWLLVAFRVLPGPLWRG